MSRVLSLCLVLCCLALPNFTEAQMISGPEVRLITNNIQVSFSLIPDSKQVQEMKDGIEKEFRLYIDLFRVWRGWPDEFVLGRFYSRTLKSDPIKKEYVASSYDGNVIVEKRYRSFESMLEGTLSVRDLTLTNTCELEPAMYFVRITAESRVRKLPPVIGYFFIFISENEFKIRKDSASFAIEAGK